MHDLTFFNDKADFIEDGNDKQCNIGDSNTLLSNIRHGIYAYSSKDWEHVKEQMIEETKKAREEHVKRLEEGKTKEEIEHEKKEAEN